MKKLSKVIKNNVVDKLDHSNLNLDVDFIKKDIQPTTENLCILIWQQIEPKLENCVLHCIKLEETETIYAKYYGE